MCATPRALYLEINRALSTNEVISAVNRFVAHCGSPPLFIRDNLNSFKAAQVKYFSSKSRIKWSFILE